MNKANIKRFIDNKILKDLSTGRPIDEVRQTLLNNSKKYKDSIKPFITEFSETEIEKITDVRSKYLSYYILYAQKRIIDLYKVESKDIYGWSQTKKFKAFLFKEKLQDNALPF